MHKWTGNICRTYKMVNCKNMEIKNSMVNILTKGQAKLLISQKIEKELMAMSSNLRREIASVQVGQNVAIVKFRNGSTIEAVSSTEGSRGHRCNVLVVDESRLVDKHTLSSIIRPFLTVVRQPKFYTKAEYAKHPHEIYLSSAYYRSNYIYDKFKSFTKAMCKGKSYFACDFPYQLAVEHGLLTQTRVDAIKNEDDMDEITWMMEMEGLFYGKFFA